MKRSVFLFLLSFLGTRLMAQNAACTVQPDSLKGTYEGSCSSNKASGFGKAKGADSYEGNFKNGYPDGYGTYTWRNGNSYTGAWKKGLREGKGEMHFKKAIGDSVVTGFWKKDIYKGEYEHPYTIHNVTPEIGRVQISKMDAKGSGVALTVESLAGGGSLTSSRLQASVTLTAYQITRGQFMSKSQNTLTNKDVTTFRGLTFPFRGTFTFGASVIDIEIYEEGFWEINVPINK
jgi:hypothetical protein